MNIVILGGAGFIGSNLCKYLSKDNNILCIDNLYTGNLSNIESIDNLHFCNCDIVDKKSLEFSVDSVFSCVDRIYNLACPASPPYYQKDPIYTSKVSFLGTLNSLYLARKYRSKYLLASTSEVYGDPLEHPQSESYRGNVNPIGIRSCYDEGKRIAESLVFDHNRMYNTNVKVARIFNTYGPNMNPNDGRVVSNFINQALRGEDITIYGTGSQTRSFCYVDDTIEGLVKLMESDDSIIGPMNLGNPNEMSMNQLAELVISKTNSISNVVYKDLPKDDPHKRKPDIHYAMSIIDWYPKISIEEGLDYTIEYYESLLD